jgi:5'-nucleotidase/UDP-sugar diphosphatase
LGNFIADAMREDVAADVGLMNSGSIRGDRVFPAGPLKRRDLVAIQPFGGIICKVELTGQALLAALNHGVARVAESVGRFPQVSGITFEVVLSAPAGDRVRHVLIQQKPLDPVQSYTVAITDYVLAGGDGYSMFATNKILMDPAHGNLLVNVLENRVRTLKEINPQVEGRIRMINEPAKR